MKNKMGLPPLHHLSPYAANPIQPWVRNITHLDANEALVFARQLEHIESTLYEKKYPLNKARDLFPADMTIPAGAESYVYYTVDAHGSFNLLTNYADDLMNIELTGEPTTGVIRGFGAAITHSIQDIRAAQMAGIPLPTLKHETARKLWEVRLDEIAFGGISMGNLMGVMNHPNIPLGAVPLGGAGSTLWVNKTPDEILEDMNSMSRETVAVTNGVEAPSHLVLPHNQYELIATTARSAVSDTTILDFFLRSNAHIREVVSWHRLKEAGSFNRDAMFTFNRDPALVELVIPQEFETFPPQEHNLAYKIPAYARTGGLKIRAPLAFRIKEGI